MVTNTKTPLQAVVGVICDCLCDLSSDDQLRALEAARITLGLRATTQSTTGRTPPRSVLPTVRVEMVNDRPVVVDETQPGRGLVVALHAAAGRPARQLGPPAARAVPVRGYVRSLRG